MLLVALKRGKASKFLSLADLPLFVSDAGDSEECVAGAHIVAQPIHAANGMQLIGPDVGSGGIDELILDEDGDDAAKDDAGSGRFRWWSAHGTRGPREPRPGAAA